MRASLLVAALALGLATPGVARAHGARAGVTNMASPDRPVRLVVDAEALGGDAKRAVEAIEKEAMAAMAEHGLRPDPDAALELRVIVRFLDEDCRDYITALEVHEAGTKLEPGLTPFECLTCVTADLAERVASRVPDAAELIAASSIQQPPTSDAAGEPTEPSSAGPDETAPRTRRASVGPLGVAGIVGLLGGTAGVVAGGVLLAKGDESRPISMGELEVIDRRPQGYAALGVGIGVFALGAVFITVDQTVLAKRRNNNVTWIPAVGRRMVGVQILRRF